jgi:hypothetical protein
MTEYLMSSEAGRTYLSGVLENFANKVDVPPDYAAHLTVEIGSGRFDKMAGRMFMAALGDVDLKDPDVARIVRKDLRSLRVNGLGCIDIQVSGAARVDFYPDRVLGRAVV